MTWGQAVKAYRLHLEQTGRRDTTVRDAGYRLDPVAPPSTPLHAVNKRKVEARINTQPSIAGRRGTLARIRAFFQWAIRQSLTYADPTIGIVVEGRANAGKQTLTRTEARMLDAALWRFAAPPWSRGRVDAAAYLLTVFYCGLREGEGLRLQVRDLDLEAETPILSIERRGKTMAAFRDLPIPGPLVPLLRSLSMDRATTALVFPGAATTGARGPTWARKHLADICTDAGLPRMSVQALRATHARLARETGASPMLVAASMGHEDTDTTIGHYSGRDVEAVQRQGSVLRVIRGG